MGYSLLFRYLGYLKTYVRNKRRPEGSIAECYITEECLRYCERYMESKNNNDVEEERPGLSIFAVPGEYSAFQPQYRTLTYTEMDMAHTHCLFNCDEVTPYIECVTLYIYFKLS